ncbi:GNAT family N-acetyltransferase [Parasphingorhabdus sp.]|uniref:GNAT family N-acetyltransferase n=1 Tax=Parasphingorhabdus sp. TaxID=2709688 RepID=UPI003A920B94
MVDVRPYMLSDKQACLAIFDGNVPDFFDATERDLFVEFLDRPKGQYFCIEKDGRILGCGGFAREDRGKARFTWGMVDQAHHGDGLGRLLTEHRLQEIVKAGDYKEADLPTTSRVAPFFEKFGFVETGREKDGFAPGMDKVLMIKPL